MTNEEELKQKEEMLNEIFKVIGSICKNILKDKEIK